MFGAFRAFARPRKGLACGHEIAFCSIFSKRLQRTLAFYRLLLVRKVSFRACRRYLVVAVFSAVIPALDIPLYPARTVVYPLPLIAARPRLKTSCRRPGASCCRSGRPSAGGAYCARMAVGGYLTAVLLSLGLFAVRMVGIRRLRRRSRLTDCGAYTPCRASADRHSLFVPAHGFFWAEGYEGRRRMIVLSAMKRVMSVTAIRRNASPSSWSAVSLVQSVRPGIAGRWLQEVHEWEGRPRRARRRLRPYRIQNGYFSPTLRP